MKILIISDAWHPQLNGVVRTYEYLCEELEDMGHQTRVIGPSDFPRTIPTPGYPEIKLAILPYSRLSAMIEEEDPDHIHIATEGPLGWATRKYCIKRGKAFSSSYHTQFPDYVAKRLARFLPFLYGFMHEQAKKFVRKFHAPASALFLGTPTLIQQLTDWRFQAPKHRLTRGVNYDVFTPAKTPEEKTEFKDLPGPVAIYVGRVAIEKSIEDFLSMDWPGSKIVVGSGPSLEELRQCYPDAHFVGKKTGAELAAHYRSADVFVFPSRTDTFGIVLIEAMACGLPVAAYDVMGPRDIIVEPFLGVLDNDLSRAAKEALQCGTAEQRTQYAQEHYTWRRAAEQFVEIISTLRLKG